MDPNRNIRAENALARMDKNVDRKTKKWAKTSGCSGKVPDTRPKGWRERRQEHYAKFDVAAVEANPEQHPVTDLTAHVTAAVTNADGSLRRGTSIIGKDGQFRPGFQAQAEALGFDGTNHLAIAIQLAAQNNSFANAVFSQTSRDIRNQGTISR